MVFLRNDGKAWGTSRQKRPLDEASARARISPTVTFHILRHTHGSHLAMRGVPMGVIAAQLGHADTPMTDKHYAPRAARVSSPRRRPTVLVLECNGVFIIQPDWPRPMAGPLFFGMPFAGRRNFPQAPLARQTRQHEDGRTALYGRPGTSPRLLQLGFQCHQPGHRKRIDNCRRSEPPARRGMSWRSGSTEARAPR